MLGVMILYHGNDKFGVWFQLNRFVQKNMFAVKMSGN